LTIFWPVSSEAAAVNGVGLSLFFRNGVMAPITFVGNPGRFLQEIDIVSTSPASTVDAGIQPLISNAGDFSQLDWAGVHQVEEQWTAAANGTFTRSRYYRGANWMTKLSTFTLTGVDAAGKWVGTPLTANGGVDNRLSEGQDDDWVRRFVARQVATGCPAMNNCTGASFVAQGLVQLRDALRPNNITQTIPTTAVALELHWSQSTQVYRVALNHVAATAFPYGYGFVPKLQAVNPPVNGMFYMPGDQLQLRITFVDGAGVRLHPVGSLPTYQQVMSGQDTSGIHYYDPTLNPQLYYALKHRESNGLVGFAGPTNKMTTAKEIAPINIFTPQVVTATTAVDGFSALVVGYPPLAVTRGTGTAKLPPDTPVSDIVTFTIPTDALPGTYVAALKARREFGGEALNRGAIINVQVGTTVATGPSPKVGNCGDCHEGRAALSVILHGLPDNRPCAACHNGSTFIGAYDVRVHTIHDRSNRLEDPITECRNCHMDTLTTPGRGILIHNAGPQNGKGGD
jgi:hypothetical protein